MHKFPINEYRRFSELPLEKFNEFRFSVYLLDFDWNYLFVNKFVTENLGPRGKDLIGRNMWTEFPQLAADSSFIQLRETLNRRVPWSFDTQSPVTAQRLYVTGYPLEDCLYCTSSIIPEKQVLIDDLREQLKRRQKGHSD